MTKKIVIIIISLIMIVLMSTNVLAVGIDRDISIWENSNKITYEQAISITENEANKLSDEEIEKYINVLDKNKNPDSKDIKQKRMLENIITSRNSTTSNTTNTPINKPTEIFDYSNYTPTKQEAPSRILNIGGNILGIIRNIAVVIGVLSLTFIGIKYMLGSVEEKAEYKQTLIPFSVGIILVVGGTTLLLFLYELAIKTF